VVHKHGARRLHYDFRLEMEGVLVSWAIPKGPSYDPQDRRLAVRTEDHPLAYGEFEGVIPEKQYGAGPVMIWDTGLWIPLDKDPVKAVQKGKLSFLLEGEKLHGEWALARMKTDDGGKENWLLIKKTDQDAVAGGDGQFLEETDFSVKSGRSLEAIAEGKESNVLSLQELERKYRSVQLATLADHPPRSGKWIHEVKYDGYRVLAFVRDGAVRIRTRRGLDWTHRFPVLKKALEGSRGTFVIDGEAVMLDENGISSFAEMQNALENPDAPMRGYFFDLLYREGKDYSGRPLAERRKALEALFKMLPEGPPLFLSGTLTGDADNIIGHACKMGLEGIISKNLDAAYSPMRSKTWLKSKCGQRQEFIICGFQPASDMDNAVGALHLGYHKDGELVYAGKVGTGFDAKTSIALYKNLSRLKTSAPPFAKSPGKHKGSVWVKPEIICEVKFGMWTQTGKVRHASFQGVREDKPAEKITKEEPEKTVRKSAKQTVRNVIITHASREIFPGENITKGDLAEFYSEMADLILPTISRRPVSIVRCPGGTGGECFFQRSKGKGMPGHIHSFDVTHKGTKHDYIYIEDVKGLVEIVQMGGIEIHPWGCRVDNTDKPDRIIFDLDPDESVPFEAVKLAALDIRKRLDKTGLRSFLKTTGGKGLHVIVPISRRHKWDTVKKFSHDLAHGMVKDLPDVYTGNMAKKMRKGRIFIDYLRNDFASTAVMDYCVRARSGAAVAVPLAWGELDDLQSAGQFTMADALARKRAGKKILKAYIETRQSLTASMLE